MKSLLMAAVLFTTLAAKAQMFIPTYEQACQIDSECSRAGGVKNGQFVPKAPPAHLIQYYAALRPLILQIAKMYRIDPVTLVATPLAENTMNVRLKDAKFSDYFSTSMWKHSAEDAATSSEAKVNPDGSITITGENKVDENGVVIDPTLRALYGAPLSVGPGQIYVSAAKHVEKLAAQIEGRPVRTSGKDIKHALFTPDGALKYAAAIIRDAQDRYAAAGYNISNRPEVLSTIYNIGRVEQAISRTKQRGTMPLPNYFGFWVATSYRSLQAQFRLPSILDVNSK